MYIYKYVYLYICVYHFDHIFATTNAPPKKKSNNDGL
jgi:hypothetical protein